MALDDLKETIETLRKRIHHRAYLEGDIWQIAIETRQVLIDPMLLRTQVGWDVGDPQFRRTRIPYRSRLG